MREKAKLLWDLFFSFFKIGLFTFGGGYAMIGIIEETCVERKKWITKEEMLNMTVLAESTPGPIAINCATYVGMAQGGILGAAFTTLGVVLPSFLIIYTIARVMENFLEITLIAKAFRGIKVGVALLIFRVGLTMAKKVEKKPLPMAIFGCAFCAVLIVNIFALRLSTIVLMLIAGTVSLAVYAFGKGGEAK